jgi:DNA-binding NtrC family response regulator
LLVEMAKSMLESLGYQVTTSRHPADAWELFRKHPKGFDLVITDQTVPEMTGIALAQKILKKCKEMPIILRTGHSETASPEKAQELGISAFAMKPLMKKELAEPVRRVLGRRRGRCCKRCISLDSAPLSEGK